MKTYLHLPKIFVRVLYAVCVMKSFMKNMSKICTVITFIVAMFGMSNFSYAATYTSSQTGNWNNSATWGGAGVPGAGDDVTIGNGATVTLTADAQCANLTYGSWGSESLNLGANNLSVSGNFTRNNASTVSATTGYIVMNGTTQNIAPGLTIPNLRLSNSTSVTLTAGGNLNITGNFDCQTGSSTFTVATAEYNSGKLYVTGTVTAPNCTFTVTNANVSPAIDFSSSTSNPVIVGTVILNVNSTVTFGTKNVTTTTAFSGSYAATNITSGTVTLASTPTITNSQTTRTGFSYYFGSGPSTEQSYTVTGTNLTANIVITPPTNYEISTGTGGSFVATNPITLTQSGGNVASTTIYVRLKAGLAVAAYNTENIVHTSTDATTKNVACSGDVLAIPTVTLASSSPAVAAGNITVGTTNNVVYSFTLTTTNATATINSVAFTNSGTATTGDITNYKLYYTSTSSTFATGTLLGTITTPAGGTFTTLTQALAVGGPYYFWITADIESAATANRTIIIDAVANAGLTYSSGSVSKAGSASAGGTKTIVYPTVVVSSANPAVAVANIGQNTTNNQVSAIRMAVTNATATVNTIAFSNSGNADYTSDITNYKLYYTATSSTFATGTCLGTITTGSSFTGLTQTLPAGSTYYFWITADIKPAATTTRTITIAAIDNSTITFASASKSGATSAGGTQTIIATAPSVTLADNTQIIATNLMKNTTNNILGRFKLDVSAANNATVNTVAFTTTGTAVTTTDLTNFKLWYSSTNNFTTPAPTLLSTLTTSLEAGAHSFTGLTQIIAYSTSGYFWITADIPSGATSNRTVAVSAMSTSDITLASGSKSGSISAAGTQTISSVITLYSIAGGGNWNDNTKWSTTAGGASCTCYPQAGTHNAVITSGNPITVNAASASVDLTINSGATLTGSSNTLTVSGNFINSGTYSATSNTTSIAGNFTSTGTFTHNNGTVVLNGTTAQSINVVGNLYSLTVSNTTNACTAGSSLTVNQVLTTDVGGVLDMSTYQLLGTLNTITNNGIIKTSNTSNPPIPTGKTWGGTVQYANTSGYVAQGTYNNLSMLNASGVPQATNNLIVNGTLTTTAGGTLDLAGYTLSGTLGTITNNGTIKSTNSNPFPTGKTWGGTIEYAATGGGQAIANGTYNNVTLSNTSNSNTANGNIIVNGTLITTASGTFDLSTNTLSGTLGTITNNGTIKTQNTSATPIPTGKTWGGTVEYNSGTAQTLMAGTYNNVTINNGNGVTTSGAVNVGGTLAFSNGKITSSTAVNITNNATNAITGYDGNKYIVGSLTRAIPANLTSSANVYDFPVGKGGTYYPYSLTTLTTGASAPTITVESFNAGCGGSGDGSTVGTLSTTEYWSASSTGDYTTGVVSITRNAGIGSYNAIARSSSAAGTYASLAGTISGNTINSSTATGSSLGYFAMCTKITIYYARQSGNWTTSTTWSTSSCGNATNTGTYPNSGDIAIICGGYTVTLTDNITISTLTVTGASSTLRFYSDAWGETLTVTGDTKIDEGGTISGVDNQNYYYVFNNLKIGTNTTTSATSSFSFIPATNNGVGVTISGMLSVGNCDGYGTAVFNYSPNLSGGTNTLTIANRTIYPNGTYTYGCSGGSCPAAPATTTTAVCPKITASSTTISGNSYVFGSGPSTVKSVTLTGSDLSGSGNIVVSTTSVNYEISNDNATWGTSFNLPFASGVITAEPKTLYVRLKAGLAKASYNGETITLVGGTASTTITLNGMVTATVSAAKSTLTPISANLVANGTSNQSLTVTAYDTDGNVAAIPGLTVVISKSSGGGTIGAVTDNGDGTYTALLTSPTTTGTGVFVATIGGSAVQNNTGSQTQATITYIAGPPSVIAVQAGNNQSADVSTSVPIDPSVLVTDANGNPVGGVDVTFTVTTGGGVVTGYEVTTNASGIATLSDWQLGAVAGTNTISATATYTTSTQTIKYPFPQAIRQQYPFGISATNADYTVLQNKIDTWVTNFYETGNCTGTGDCARIKWDDPTKTVSEGIGYGMLIFVYADNSANQYQEKFDKLWNYYDYWSRSNGGLMQWRINGFTSVSDAGAATDADIDVALALIQAHKQWGSAGAVNYLQEAETILAKIYDNEVDANHLFKPGDQWNSVQNPSYAALFAIKKAAEIQVSAGFTETRDWTTVYNTMQTYLSHYQNGTTGLWPNWTDPNVTGGCVANPGWYSEGCYYGLDALRTPWRVAWDHAWYGSANSASMLNTTADWLNSSAISGDPNNVIGKFTDITTGTQTSYALDESSFVGGLAASYMANNNVATDQTDLNEWYANLMARDLSNSGAAGADPANNPTGYQYYSPTLQILFGLTLTGNTPDFNTLDPVIAAPITFTATGDALLPITLIDFTAMPKNDAVKLDWITATETNNDFFTLERSDDGTNWNNIYTCKGAGTSTIEHSYSFIDYQKRDNIVYYMLAQTDYDGAMSYSNIISILLESANFEIVKYLNDIPSNCIFELQFSDIVDFNNISITNMAGAVVYQQVFRQTVYEQIELQLPPGAYTLINTTKNTIHKERFIVK